MPFCTSQRCQHGLFWQTEQPRLPQSDYYFQSTSPPSFTSWPRPQILPHTSIEHELCERNLWAFKHDFYCKIFYAGQEFDDSKPYNPKMYINSDWNPDDWMIPTAAVRRYNNFRAHTISLFKKRLVPSNLLHHQHLVLRHLQLQNEFLIV